MRAPGLLPLAAVALLVPAIAGCGRKGPPLAPVVHVPEGVGAVSVRRLGDDVLVTVRLPTRNVDGSTPVDLTRVELHGLTATTAPTPARVLEAGALVATWTRDTADGADGATGVPAEITLRDTLEADELEAAPGEAVPPARQDAVASPAQESGGETGTETASETTSGTVPETAVPEPPSRYYLVVPIGARDRAGPQGRVVPVPLAELPAPPVAVAATYDERSVTVTWTPLAAADDPVRYDVYRQSDRPAGPVVVARPAPRNATPASGPPFTEPLSLDGERHCYEVRSVRGEGASAVAGRPSPAACVTAVDTFAPAPPTGLTAIELQGAIDLTWAAGPEPDLGGYVVLRGEPGDATLTALTAEPITETRYLDRDVRVGVRYTYAVQAVDTQPEPNVSAESARLERTAR